MADEENQEQTEEKPSGGGLGKIVLVLVVAFVAAIGGLATYLFVLKPMLEKSAVVAEAVEEDLIPLAAVEIEFPASPVNVIRDGQEPAATLLFGVTLECANAETLALVTAHQARFVDMINKLHASRTRAELDDVLLMTESIQRQLMQKLNDLLKRLQEEPADEIRITAVLHHTFVVQDPL